MAERGNFSIGSGGTGADCGGMSVMQRNRRSKHHKRLRPIRALHLFSPVMFPSVKKGCCKKGLRKSKLHPAHESSPGGGTAAWSRG